MTGIGRVGFATGGATISSTMPTAYSGPTVSSGTAPKPQTELEREAVRLADSTDELHRTIGRLTSKLEHVLYPDLPPNIEGNEKEVEAGTTVGKLLREQTSKVNQGISRINTIINRLGI